MAFTPVAWAYKDLVTSVKLAAMVENTRAHDHRADGSQGAPSPFCILSNGTANPATATNTALSFPEANELADPFGMHVAGALTRITIPANMGGVYAITGTLFWATNTVGRRQTLLAHNGAGFAYQELPSVAAGAWPQTTAGQRLLAAGDYVELMGYQSSGAVLAITQGMLAVTLIARA